MCRLPCKSMFALLLLAAGTAWAVPAADLPDDLPSFESSTCARVSYPTEPIANGLQGVTTLAMLVGVDGAPGRTEIVNSSGSPVLDKATQAWMATCRFRPAVVRGRAVERWLVFSYIWKPEGNDGLANVAWMLDIAAAQGRAAAEYALYLMFLQGEVSQASRYAADRIGLLRSAAKSGHCAAQYMFANVLATGGAMKPDLPQAREWYRRAAACGHPAANDRLEDLAPAGERIDRQASAPVGEP